jgi:hypothetical protein
MTCTFIGHKDCPFSVKERLEGVILELINKDIKHFFVGNNGNFDYLVQETLSKLIKMGFSINVSIVLSYINETSISEHQELTVFPEELTNAPKRFAIQKLLYIFAMSLSLTHKNKTDLTNYSKRRKNMENNNTKKKSVWDVVLKVIIAALSALAGALGAQAMSL